MNQYYPESMVSAMQAMSGVESMSNTARRTSDEHQSQISRALRPVLNQAAHMQIDIKPMKFDLSALKMQTEMNNSIAQKMKELSMTMQHPALEAFKELSFTNTSVFNALKEFSISNNILNDALKINIPKFHIPIYKVPLLYQDDFRKSVVVQESINEVDEYKNKYISKTEYSFIMSRSFDMEQRLFQLEEKERERTAKKEKDNELTVADVISRLITLLAFFGIEFDYETTKFILESFVELIKLKFDHIE